MIKDGEWDRFGLSEGPRILLQGELMGDICPICGLPKELCVCGEITQEETKIVVRLERRRWNRPATIIEGIDPKTTDMRKLVHGLRTKLACGGSVKNGQIILQGDHREAVKEYLVKIGFNSNLIEVQ